MKNSLLKLKLILGEKIEVLAPKSVKLVKKARVKYYENPLVASIITNLFQKLYFYSKAQTWQNSFWLGIPTLKCPLDLWIYQEILQETKPDVIIESGTFYGGSALFLATMCETIGNGRVITLDIKKWGQPPKHNKITYLLASSTAEETVEKVRNLIEQNESVLVILDSEHFADHVLNEMRIYSQFVTSGSYLIVEDTNINHPVRPMHGPGPMEAVKTFLKENSNFIVDKKREKFHLTFNPNGYLKKVS